VKEARPAAVLAYCIIAGVFLIIGAAVGTSDMLHPSTIAPTFGDAMLAYLPLALVATGVVGMWFMRWWAVALFWLLIAVVTVASLFVPFEGSSEGFVWFLAMNAAILSAVIALPPTIIAVIYRRRFR